MNKIYAECINDLKLYGIALPEHTPKLIVNTRAKKRWGQATYGRESKISINHRLLEDNVDIFGARNTMMHEILHLCAPRAGHTGEWKSLANTVNKKSGGKYNIKRTSSQSEYGVEDLVSSRYMFECDKCGMIIKRDRASNFTKNPGHYTHKGCTGRFRRV